MSFQRSWRKCQGDLRIGYQHIAHDVDPKVQYAGLWVIGDALEIMCDPARPVLDEADDIATVRQDRRLAWLLAHCAAHRCGDPIDPIVSWPELEAMAHGALDALKDPGSDEHAIYQAYQELAHTVRILGASTTVVDTVTELWRQHIEGHGGETNHRSPPAAPEGRV